MKNGHLIVIGGSRGIGRAFCKLVATEWDFITVLSRNIPEDAENWPGCIQFKKIDILKKEAVAILLEQTISEYGKVRGLVFFQRYRGSGDVWDGNLATSLTSTRNIIEMVKNHFISEGDKAIVLISSIASKSVADEQDEGYHTAKAGLLGLCRYYGYKLGPKGIRVNCVSPGTLLKEESKDFFIKNSEIYALYQRITPLHRMGTAEEVAKVIRFLLSTEASFVTGQEVVVDGGVGLYWQESLAKALIL